MQRCSSIRCRSETCCLGPNQDRFAVLFQREFRGPLLAGIVGEVYVLSFVSAAKGSVAMILAASIFASVVIFFFEFGDLMTAGILMARPTGLAAVGVTWANR